ncbi:S8 family serine peptidase [Sporosarcina sp. 179-K 3D1 HS]|uniref:subtilisin-like serine protease QhpE n=1 Tax=Sporosarcina sp. 179-K 3D1 HS TaxID=3232169 RepID=UPI00399FA45E
MVIGKQAERVDPLSEFTGKGVKIAVLDSGVNVYHSHIDQELGGLAFRVNREGGIELHEDIRDYLGHGTAVTAVMRQMAPDAEILVGKIFDEKLACYPSVLAEAIDWAVEQEVHIINLSLGVNRNHQVIEEACAAAIEKGVAVVASYNKQTGLLWPANYPGVFGVRAGEVPRMEWQLNALNNFSACGFPRELPEETQIYNIHGHSFAAAHFTSWLARLYEKQERKTVQDAMSYFQQYVS